MLSEKQFVKLVQKTSAKYSKNNNISHDEALYMFLEARMDSILLININIFINIL